MKKKILGFLVLTFLIGGTLALPCGGDTPDPIGFKIKVERMA